MIDRNILEQIIYGLNIDLAWEYAAAIQYLQHASMLDGTEYLMVIEELKEHACDEFGHAETLSDIIQYLGGVPTVQVAPIETSSEHREMIRQDLEGEYGALRRYLKRIKQLEMADLYDISQQIRNIAVDEQEHTNDLETALGIENKIIGPMKLIFEDEY